MKDQAVKDKFIEMRAQGLSYRAIARELSVSTRTLTVWNRKFSREIKRVRGEDLDALHEKYLELKKHRVAALVNIIEKAQSQLGERDFGELTTGELLRLYIRAVDALRNEIEPLVHTAHLSNLPEDFAEALEPTQELAEANADLRKNVDPGLARWEEIIRRCAILPSETDRS
jgi:transposase-like protein